MITRNKMTGKCYRDGVEITSAEYERIRELMRNKPIAPMGYGYRFEGEAWVLYELPAAEEQEEELSETEQKAMAYDIITGVRE